MEQLFRAAEACGWSWIGPNMLRDQHGDELAMVFGSPCMLRVKAARACLDKQVHVQASR